MKPRIRMFRGHWCWDVSTPVGPMYRTLWPHEWRGRKPADLLPRLQEFAHFSYEKKPK
jgi:hypothetical protein